jgi:hypothetical protein
VVRHPIGTSGSALNYLCGENICIHSYMDDVYGEMIERMEMNT